MDGKINIDLSELKSMMFPGEQSTRNNVTSKDVLKNFAKRVDGVTLEDDAEYSCAIRPALSPYPGTNPVTSGRDSCDIRPLFLLYPANKPAPPKSILYNVGNYVYRGKKDEVRRARESH